MEETISLKELFDILKKRFNLIAVITLAAVALAGVISFFFLTPIYQSSTQILVNKANEDQMGYTAADVQTNLQLINTYNVIIKSPAILEIVIEELDLDMTTGQLNEKITVQSEKDSQVINLSVQDEDPYQAATIANKTAEIFQQEIVNIMSVDNVSILAMAEVTENQGPVKPKPLLNIAIALVVGLMVGVGAAFLLEYFDNTIKTEQDVEKILELPVLGVISKMDQSTVPQTQGERKTRLRSETIGS